MITSTASSTTRYTTTDAFHCIAMVQCVCTWFIGESTTSLHRSMVEQLSYMPQVVHVQSHDGH